MRAILVALVAVIPMVGCGTGSPVETENLTQVEPLPSEEQLREYEAEINGPISLGAPEVGKLETNGGFCTATAISPKVILTARHCLTAGVPSTFVRFEGLQAFRVPTVARWSHPSYDIALLKLAFPVPHYRDIKPWPVQYELSTAWGFGGQYCHWQDGAWRYNVGGGARRWAWFRPLQTSVVNSQMSQGIVCPGDSGGPVMSWNDGRIYGVLTGAYGTQSGDRSFFTPLGLAWNDIRYVRYVFQNG